MATLRQQWLNNQSKEADRRNTEQAAATRVRNDELQRVAAVTEEKAEQKRLFRMMAQAAQEEEVQNNLIRDKENREIRDRQRDQEFRLAGEMERRKLEATKDEKMRQQIREGSSELRELEAKLRAAYVAKERVAQMAEKRALECDILHEEANIMRVMKEEAERASQLEREWELTRAGSKVRYQQELERQLEEQELKKQEAYQEFLKEKLMIDEVVRKIYEEDQRERELQMQKRHMTREYIEEFNQKRQAWKLAEKARMEEENRKIMAYMKAKIAKEEQEKEAKKEREKHMFAVQEKLSEEIQRRDRERREMEDIRQELVLQEEDLKAFRFEQDQVEKKIRQRLEMQADYARQMQLRQQALEVNKAEEERYRAELLAKFAEDDKLEQLNAQKRRMKQLEHKRSVEELLARRRADMEAQREQEKVSEEELKRGEDFRRRIIEEERQKMLKEHAHKLLGYLPRGVLLNEDDVTMLGPEFQEKYRKHEMDPMDEEYWERYHDERQNMK